MGVGMGGTWELELEVPVYHTCFASLGCVQDLSADSLNPCEKLDAVPL